MRISVFGLGYVGCVSAACLAHEGHQVVGVDTNPEKVDLIRAGVSPIVEPGLQELLSAVVESGRLTATTDAHAAVTLSDVTFVCVGTPSRGNGSLMLDHVESVSREIGAALAGKDGYHVVAVRSTVLPGTVEERLVPFLEGCSGKAVGPQLGVCMVPEFLREGSALEDYFAPSVTVIGQADEASGSTVEEIFRGLAAPIVRTSIRSAEMVKYVSNAFHALKVAFANEIGTLCKAHGIDGREVMEIFSLDRRLNISAAYLRPGYAFGGSCLPKDTRALVYRARERDVEAPVLAAALASNEIHVRRGIELVERAGRKRVGVLGLSFKPGTDDVRESPVVPLIETLVGKGYEVCVFDEQVELSRLIGTNKSFLETQIPHIASLMRPSIDAVLERAETLIVTNASQSFLNVARRLGKEQVLIDLVGIGEGNAGEGRYEGICW